MTKYIIGIDLGTTNCTMAYAKVEEPSEITQFAVPQMTKQGIEENLFSLPSFVLFPVEESGHLVGAFARDRGAELPGRLVSSAKSWLCHDSINRREKWLPLEPDENVEKISPVEALSYLLGHLQEKWDLAMPESAFRKQTVLITVPASFDPSARQLIEEAAQLAEYPEVILLEEPQAAFYAWLYAQGDAWRKTLAVSDKVLVVDIGGGTTDFSLIEVGEESGHLMLKRLAVGDHLLLGGDNIDFALAYQCRQKLQEIDDHRMSELVHRCREAKEILLGDKPPEKVVISLKGRGTKLIGGQIKTELTRKEVLNITVDGFFPFVGSDELPVSEKRAGMSQIGLPYVRDPRISCQIAKFLQQGGSMPTHVLFNGGTLRGKAIQERVLELLNSWKGSLVKVLEGADYDCAVSRGAVYYGLSRLGEGIRIRAGTSRAYYIGVEDSAPAIPGFTPPLKALCVVPFGMEEGSEVEIEEQEFSLLLGENTTFRFFSSTTLKDAPGQLMKSVANLQELHPIETNLERRPEDGATARIRLKSKVTELGALQLWCVADDDRKWKLEFDTR